MSDEGKDYMCCLHCDNVSELTDFTWNDYRGDGNCKTCNGTGEIDNSLMKEFGVMVEVVMTLGLDVKDDVPKTVSCPKCSGTGQCQTCGGSGRVKRKRFDDDDDSEEENEEEDDGYEDEGYDSYDSSDYSSYTESSNAGTTDNRSEGGGILLFLVIALSVFGLFYYNKTKKASSESLPQTYSTPVSYSPPQPAPIQVQTPPSNPYGEGNGRISFYKSCPSMMCDNILVYFEDRYVGNINDSPLSEATCSGTATISTDVKHGKRLFIFKDEHERMWKEYVEVSEGSCALIKVSTPELNDEDEDGIDDFVSMVNYENVAEEEVSLNSLHSIVCIQCQGNKEIEVNAYCKVCSISGWAGRVSGYVTCSDCNGSGIINHNSCPACQQTGKVKCSGCSGTGRAITKIKCNLCNGKGKIKA